MAVVALSKTYSFPCQEVVSHEIAVFSGRGTVRIVEDVVEDKDNPGCESLSFKASLEDVGYARTLHVLPHLALVGFVVGVESLAPSGLFPEFDVVLESFL